MNDGVLNLPRNEYFTREKYLIVLFLTLFITDSRYWNIISSIYSDVCFVIKLSTKKTVYMYFTISFFRFYVLLNRWKTPKALTNFRLRDTQNIHLKVTVVTFSDLKYSTFVRALSTTRHKKEFLTQFYYATWWDSYTWKCSFVFLWLFGSEKLSSRRVYMTE